MCDKVIMEETDNREEPLDERQCSIFLGNLPRKHDFLQESPR